MLGRCPFAVCGCAGKKHSQTVGLFFSLAAARRLPWCVPAGTPLHSGSQGTPLMSATALKTPTAATAKHSPHAYSLWCRLPVLQPTAGGGGSNKDQKGGALRSVEPTSLPSGRHIVALTSDSLLHLADPSLVSQWSTRRPKANRRMIAMTTRAPRHRKTS